jgi:hypothetical protein
LGCNVNMGIIIDSSFFSCNKIKMLTIKNWNVAF